MIHLLPSHPGSLQRAGRMTGHLVDALAVIATMGEKVPP